MSPRLIEVAQQQAASWTPGAKGVGYYELYGRYLADFADRPATMLELGVYQGDSTRVFATYLAKGKVIAVDIEDRGLDFSNHANVVFERADQTDAKRLHEICAKHAPTGLDIIIDDAAHLGALSLASYRALVPLLNPGGYYIVEDWGTGYWNDWPDGHEIEPAKRPFGWGLQKRVPSHDFGMVGFLKSVLDDVSCDVAPTRESPRRPQVFEFMHVFGGAAILKKTSA